MKNIAILGAIVIAALIAFYLYTGSQSDEQPNTSPELGEFVEDGRVMDPQSVPQERDQQAEKLKADTFTGTLEKVDTSCFADGECFVEVDGKHVTVLMGWSRDTVGSVLGTDGIGGLEAHIGQEVEVYAQDNSDGTYTLYGNEGFYIKVL